MDLDLTADQQAAADAAVRALANGRLPAHRGTLTELVLAARALGRAAGRVSFHGTVLAALCGWDGDGAVAVGLGPGDGVAPIVPSAAEATVILVRTGTNRLGVLPAERATLTPWPTLADPACCRVGFSHDDVVETLDADVDAAIARAALVRAADALGAAEAALEATTAHVRDRHAWGAPVGSLQAVQHRCADMLLDVTLAADAVFDAAGVADRGAPEFEIRLAIARAAVGAVPRGRRVTASAHQLAGGQGILADAPFHRWYRRAKDAEALPSTMRSHRDLIAAALVDDARKGSSGLS